MNFIKEIEIHLKSKVNNSEKVTALSNLLMLKLMYIPVPQAIVISLKISSFQTNFNPTSDNFYITQIILALLEYRQSNFNDAIEHVKYLEHWDYSDFEDKYISLRKVIYGISYRSLGNLNESLQYLHDAVDRDIDVAKVEQYQSFLHGLCLYHIAEMYGEMMDYEAMLKKLKQLLPFSEKINNVDLNNRCLNGIGRAYLALEDYDNALNYLKIASEHSKRAANTPFISRNLHDLGVAYAQLERYDLSLDYYQKSLNLRKKAKDTSALITTLMSMSEIHIEQRSHHKAIDLLHEALGIAVPLNVSSKIYKIYQYLSTIYERQGQFERALAYFKKFHSLKEDTDNVSSTQVENQKVREINSQLRKQKKLIEIQKQQIETSINKLKETNRYLENFASVAAHDLKAPMRIAANFSKIIEHKYKTLIDKKDKEYLRFISDNMNKLNKMIDDLLSLSKIDQDLPNATVVDTQKAVNEAILRLDIRIAQYRAEIKLQNELPEVVAHPSLVTQLFQNLIDNAVKYSYSRTNEPSVYIFSRLSINNTQFQEFEVRDNGNGIPVNLQPYIFDLFSGASETDGTGIGLATCRKIVKHYGGRIWVKSEMGKGTSIFFTLPAYRS